MISSHSQSQNEVNGGVTVTLLVYDLSNGMAKNVSKALTGKQIDAIYHTSVLVFGLEIAFGKGIEVFVPHQTPYGSAIESIEMGISMVPKVIFLEYLEQMKSIWTAEKYHLLDNNCNNFSNEVCQFLVGSSIPIHITSLPGEFLSTPLGQMLKPMIEQSFGPSSKHPTLPNARSQPSSSSSSHGQVKRAIITSVTSLATLQRIVLSNRCVVIDFTSENCGPCVAIAPEFERLIEENDRVIGVKVETSTATEICQAFQISATPTFKFYLDGNEFSEMKGANRGELKSSFEFLLYTAYPPHKHARLGLSTLEELANSPPCGFIVSSNLDLIFKKLDSMLVEANPPFSFKEELSTLQAWMKTDYSNSAILPHDWQVAPCKILELLPVSKLFPLLDILRLLALNPTIKRHFSHYDSSDHAFLKTLKRVVSSECSMATKLMLLKFSCNLFPAQRQDAKESLILSTIPVDGLAPRDALTQLVVGCLLAPEPQLRQAAALAVINLSWVATAIGSDHDDEWSTELLAAVTSALETQVKVKESNQVNDETVFRLAASAGLLLAFAHESVVETGHVLSLASHLEAVQKLDIASFVDKKTILPKICSETLSILLNDSH